MKPQPNLFAGMGSHQSARANTTTWLSPVDIRQPLGTFDLDPCAARGWPTARVHWYGEPGDCGLSRDWFGRVWLNPPYTPWEIRQWMERMRRHNHGTALVFARTETRFFFESVWGHARALLFLERRVFFHHADGRRSRKNAGAPSVLIAYGDQDCDRLADSDLRGAFVLLQSASHFVVAVPVTWRDVVIEAFGDDGSLALADLYDRVADHPKTGSNRHWRDKIRQQLQRHDCFRQLRRGVWELKPCGM